MEDPLLLLREWVSAGKRAELVGEEICFGDQKFHRKTPTSFRSHNGEGELYELDALWFYIENKQRFSHSVYLVNCSRRQITPVDVGDTTNVSRYLLAQIEESDVPNITRSNSFGGKPEPTPSRAAKRQKTSHGAGSSGFGSFYESLPPVKPQAISSEPVINWDDWKSREVPAATRASVLISSTPLTPTEKDYVEYWKLIDKVANQSEGRRIPQTIENTRQNQIRSRTMNPVIVVPPGINSLLTVANARVFLQEGRYILSTSREQKKKDKLKRQSKIDAVREVEFEIINDPVKEFSHASDWNRIVAVFALGKEWQFKRWEKPWNSPSHIFSKACGFYMHWDDTPVSKNVQQWRLTYLPIAKNRRHLDHKISLEFWKVLENFLPGHANPKLLW